MAKESKSAQPKPSQPMPKMTAGACTGLGRLQKSKGAKK